PDVCSSDLRSPAARLAERRDSPNEDGNNAAAKHSHQNLSSKNACFFDSAHPQGILRPSRSIRTRISLLRSDEKVCVVIRAAAELRSVWTGGTPVPTRAFSSRHFCGARNLPSLDSLQKADSSPAESGLTE